VFTLIEGGDVYAPQPLGACGLLLVGDRIGRVGPVERAALRALELPCTVVEATDCLVLPGFVDPHEHLIGAGGEQGVASRMPEVPFEDIALAGITTVVGCLGTDTTTRSLAALVARAHQLVAGGLTAYVYTGGFPVPPPTLTGSVTDDLVLIDRVLGVGEVAIADMRSAQPSVAALAALVAQAYVGGLLSGKAGVTHFHVGPGRDRLASLRALLAEHEVAIDHLYPTHVNRTEALLDEAIALAQQGAYVDMDTVDDGLAGWLRYYREHGGPLDRLTVSSDAHTPGGSPAKLRAGFVAAVREARLGLAEAAALFTRNPASALRLDRKGCLQEGADADVVVLDRATLAVMDVFAGGRALVRDGRAVPWGEESV
jgi:beta-aspartyl-dipeptidase (metallo-type)